jgi:hypothetical protein
MYLSEGNTPMAAIAGQGDRNRQEDFMAEESGRTERIWTEEFEVAGAELVDRIKELIKAGNVRRLILRTQDNKLLLEIPFTAGAVAGGVVVLVAPVLAALGQWPRC